MEDNNPTIWEEAFWDTANPLNLSANPNVNGHAGSGDVMQMDDGVNPSSTLSTTTVTAEHDGSSSNKSKDTTNEMYLLYTAPGYRG